MNESHFVQPLPPAGRSLCSHFVTTKMPLSLSNFLICQMELMIILSSQGCWGNKRGHCV